MRVGFTGTREGMTAPQRATLHKLLLEFEGGEFHHGDCLGADAEAHDIAAELYTTVIHPPLRATCRAFKSGNVVLQKQDYLERNKDIVDNTALLIAAPKTLREEHRSGTWSTVRYARKNDKQVIIIYPDGSTS